MCKIFFPYLSPSQQKLAQYAAQKARPTSSLVIRRQALQYKKKRIRKKALFTVIEGVGST